MIRAMTLATLLAATATGIASPALAQVAIGTETGMQNLADCALVVAPYTVDGERVGTVGVLGPTRMNYPQALATVDVVSDRLGRRLGEG